MRVPSQGWRAVAVWLERMVPSRPGLYLFLYGAILATVNAVESYRRLRQREVRESKLEAMLARARLESLQNQLHPHFLFNTLHSIATLVEDDPRAARNMIAGLGELLRASLQKATLQEVPLREELRLLDQYLDIEQTRFGDRLRITRSLDPRALDDMVPYLVFQPLVENAIRHGIAPSSRAGSIEIVARRVDRRLHLAVRDDGSGASPRRAREGIGLSNTRARLEQLYASDHSLVADNRSHRGFEVSLEIPSRPDPGGHHAAAS